jgi:hypothetical protein
MRVKRSWCPFFGRMLLSLLLCGKMRSLAAGVGRRGARPPSTGDNPIPPRRFLLCPRLRGRWHLYGGLPKKSFRTRKGAGVVRPRPPFLLRLGAQATVSNFCTGFVILSLGSTLVNV